MLKQEEMEGEFDWFLSVWLEYRNVYKITFISTVSYLYK